MEDCPTLLLFIVITEYSNMAAVRTSSGASGISDTCLHACLLAYFMV